MNIEIAFLASMAFMTCTMWFWILNRTMKDYARREEVYFKIIRSLENRLTAKDLAGFMALESEDKRNGSQQGVSRTDEAEAQIAALRTTAGEYYGAGS